MVTCGSHSWTHTYTENSWLLWSNKWENLKEMEEDSKSATTNIGRYRMDVIGEWNDWILFLVGYYL